MKPIQTTRGLALILFLGFSGTEAVLAAQTLETGACQEDSQKFCGEIPLSTGAVQNCLTQHHPDLSQSCQAALQQNPKTKKPDWQLAQERIQKAWQACEPDVETFCEGVQAKGDQVEQCLKAHEAQLSAGCQAARKVR